MKKLFALLLMLVLCIFAFAACDDATEPHGGNEPPAHTHNYSTLKFDNEFHWFECECEEKNNVVSHNIKNGECACGYIVPHSHEYTTSKTDETQHWYECTCGDKSGAESHKDGTATCTELAVCSVCNESYGELEKHDHATLKKNETAHWYECVCGDKKNIQNHIPGAEATETTDQKCTVCDCVITPALGHVHTLHLTKVDAKAQSCTKEGNIEYYTCDCGKWFADNTATTEITDKASVVISKDAHINNTLKYSETEHWNECVCGDKSNIEAHKGGTATCTDLAVCSVCSASYGEIEKHDHATLKKNETAHWYECVCGDKKNIQNHIPGAEATETTDQKCTVCDCVITPALGHVHTLHLTKVDAKAQSCTKEGNIEYYTCDCGKWFADNTATTEITDKASVVISKDAHIHNTLKYSETQHWYECTCGDKSNIENHKGGTATCEEKPVCALCNVEYGSANGHTEGVWITDIEPTCTEAGSKHQICSVCSDTIKNATIEAEHSLCVTSHPTTCLGSGYDEYKCERCEYSRTENWEQMYCTVSLLAEGNKYYTLTVNIYGGASEYSDINANINVFQQYGTQWSMFSTSKNESYDGSWSMIKSVYVPGNSSHLIYVYIDLTTGEGFSCEYNVSSRTYNYEYKTVPHKYESLVTAPTCAEQGYTTHTCSVCGVSYKDTYVSVPHIYESVVTAPTCAEQGYTTHTCTVCGDNYKDTYVSVDGHNFKKSNSCSYCAVDIADATIDSYTMSATANDNVKGYVVSRADGNYDVYIKGAGSMKGYTSSPFVVDGYRIISAYIENGVTNIGTNVFSNCSSLEIITLPDSITSIGAGAFSDCASLKGVTIPAGVVNINSHAFRNCHSLKEIYFNATAMDDVNGYIFYNTGTSGVKVVIGANVTKIPGSLFCVPFVPAIYSPKITSLEFEVGSVCQSIGEMAFTLCSLPVNITLPEGLTSIGDSAFYKCTDLTSVTIPSSVISIGNSAFGACNNLASITIPSSVINIGDSAFSSCSNLAFIAIEGSPYIGPNAFADTTYYNSTSNWQNKILYIDNCLIAAKITVETCIIKEDTTVIAGEAFSNCTSLINITIPDSVTSIGNSAFYNCSSLTIVVIGDGVTSIANEVFYGCSSLISITIPDSVTSIGEYAFYRCNNLMTVVIPNSVTSIGFVSFHECSNLANVYYKGTESDWAKISFDWNPTLKSAPCYYYSESEPTDEGNYWHYVNGVPTQW